MRKRYQTYNVCVLYDFIPKIMSNYQYYMYLLMSIMYNTSVAFQCIQLRCIVIQMMMQKSNILFECIV